MIEKTISVVFFTLSVLFCGCTSIGDYSTDPDECYEGEIIDAEFVRGGGFGTDVKLVMGLDANALGRGEAGAWITTDDGMFDSAEVKQIKKLTRDPLSMLDFPSGRVRNYLAYAPLANGTMATVVISLMENESVEVRIMQPSTDTDVEIEEDTSLFGVFRLLLKENCTPPQSGFGKEPKDEGDARDQDAGF